MKHRGIIKFYNDIRGYGFITKESDQSDIFLHATGIIKKPIGMNDLVEFEEKDGAKGVMAVNVVKIG